MEYTILIAGFGGQGILSAGRFVAAAALIEGREVSWLPSYGPEMRGGTANCSVIISDDPIGSPILNEMDALVALNEPSLAKFANMIRPGGLVLLDSALIQSRPARHDLRVIPVGASRLASEAGNMTFAAIILLGCLSAATGSFKRNAFEKALYEALPRRHHHLIPQEMELFEKGMAFAGQAGRDAKIKI